MQRCPLRVYPIEDSIMLMKWKQSKSYALIHIQTAAADQPRLREDSEERTFNLNLTLRTVWCADSMHKVPFILLPLLTLSKCTWGHSLPHQPSEAKNLYSALETCRIASWLKTEQTASCCSLNLNVCIKCCESWNSACLTIHHSKMETMWRPSKAF